LAFTHFCVDFTCVFLLYAWFSGASDEARAFTSLVFVGYGVIAFGFQPLIGAIADVRRRLNLAVLGIVLLFPAFLCLNLPVLLVPALGLGNACFHVAGGIDSLRLAKGRMARSGIFVSAGAPGVALGVLLGGAGTTWMWMPGLLLVACLVLTLVFVRDYQNLPIIEREGPERFRVAGDVHPFWLVIGVMAFVVFVRSLVGTIEPMPWKTGALLVLAAALAATAGKALGGILADRLGAKTTAGVSLALALPCLALGFAQPLFCCLGIALLNMSMPITLCALAQKLPHSPGLAFGITTLAILVGAFLPLPALPVPATLILVSGLLLLTLPAVWLLLVDRKKDVFTLAGKRDGSGMVRESRPLAVTAPKAPLTPKAPLEGEPHESTVGTVR
jgi:FSR family fosmidomycin resistance protein-like MFS transporter